MEVPTGESQVGEGNLTRSRWREIREERAGDDMADRTKTDTGRRGEYPKALERTVVKELGKFTP